VAQKPAKPLFFGTKKGTLIFGVPGNPVSTFFVFCTHIKLAIQKMMGKEPRLEILPAILGADFKHKPGRKHFVPARVSEKTGALQVEPVSSYHGSADIASVAKANAFMIVDGDVSLVKRNSTVEVLLW
jgi:molybdopterin molybdotransferase